MFREPPIHPSTHPPIPFLPYFYAGIISRGITTFHPNMTCLGLSEATDKAEKPVGLGKRTRMQQYLPAFGLHPTFLFGFPREKMVEKCCCAFPTSAPRDLFNDLIWWKYCCCNRLLTSRPSLYVGLVYKARHRDTCIVRQTKDAPQRMSLATIMKP